MIVVTGTKRSGTSLWMHVLVAAGLPLIGERCPVGWEELLATANPDGFFESELVAGVYFRTNPHPLTGAYLAPQQTRSHAVKIFIPGLVRTDVAFIDRCVATVRSWRDHVASTRRVQALPTSSVAAAGDGPLPPALQWWCHNFALIRDLAIRRYPAHVVSYEGLLRDPERVVAEVLAWIGQGDARAAAGVVRPQEPNHRGDATSDEALADGIDPRHLEVFDELHATIDAERPLTKALVDRLNQTDQALRPLVLEQQASADAQTIADILGRG